MGNGVFTYTLIKNGKVVFRGNQEACYRALLDIKTDKLIGKGIFSRRDVFNPPVQIYKPRYFDKLLTVSSRFEHSD